MIKALVLLALALAMCQAMPAGNDFELGQSLNLNRIMERSSQLDSNEMSLEKRQHMMNTLKRNWLETSNGKMVPLLSVRREAIHEWMQISNDSVSQLNEDQFVKRVWNALSTEEQKRFVEPIRQVEETKREFEANEDFAVRDLPWTNEAKRVWMESNGTVTPVRRAEWMQFLNESVVTPLKREWLESAATEKREFFEREFEAKRGFNVSEPVALRLMNEFNRHSRSLSEEEQRSFNETEFVGMCNGSKVFKYYQAHPTNQSYYIQCDPWGQPIMKACESGLVWDQWRLRCCTPESVRNSTFAQGYDFDMLVAAESLFDCNLPQYTCLNGGACSKLSTGNVCVCSGNYTGDLCEIRVDASSIFSEILSGGFTLEEYRRRQAEDKSFDDLKYFEQYKTLLSKPTYEELVRYLSIYKKGEVRYDRLVSNLVEDVLQDIYPDAFYLSVFNASAESVANVVRMVPNLLSYAKYSNERYVQVFYQYQKALEKLVGVLNVSWPHVEHEASEYYKLTSLYLNHSVVLSQEFNRTVELTRESPVEVDQQSVEGAFSFGSRPVATHKSGLAGGAGPVQWTDSEVMEKMRTEYNQTMQDTNELFDFLERFRSKALVEIRRDQKVVSLPLSEAKFELAKETVERFNEISKSSAEIWDSLVNYGFWYLTNIFSKSQF